MEVNKEEAARCRDLGADALRRGQNERAVKMFTKSLHLYPLPGVKTLLGQAERKFGAERQPYVSSSSNDTRNDSNRASASSGASVNRSKSSVSTPTSSSLGENNGRSFTSEQVEIVQSILKAKEGGRGAHYRVLSLEQNCDEAAIKKAYRKLALKLHPDKNSAPHADEAFKAVGLAYATLSDTQKRAVYDRYGDEDPDNRGGGVRRGGNTHFHGQEVSPEDIFNMFFSGGMPAGAGGPGFRVYSSGFGPGFSFGGMHPNMARAHAQQQQRRQQQQQAQDIGLGQFVQFLPLLLIMLLSFFNMQGEHSTGTGGGRYFSLTPAKPFTNPLHTKLTKVKDIPYYVTDQFIRTINRDRYQLAHVERMVEKSYERYLVEECKNQKDYKRKLDLLSTKQRLSDQERLNLSKKAANFELTRCVELEDLFPESAPQKRNNAHSEF